MTYQKVTQWNPEGFLLVTIWFVISLSVVYNGFLTVGFHMVTHIQAKCYPMVTIKSESASNQIDWSDVMLAYVNYNECEKKI